MFIGPYEIVSELGDGGMGTVKLARAPSGELVVVKQAHPGDPLLRDLLSDEGRVGLRLKHPNIVETLDFFEHEGEPVLVVAFVSGASLADIRAKGPLAPGVVCRVGRQIAEALDALHHATGEDGRSLAVLHRDVTPNNIMIGYDGNARLIDLGIAKSDDRRSQKTQTGFLRGTLRYMAPEVFEDSRYSPQSDLWALGISLLDAALGRQAIKGSEGEVVGKVMTGRVLELRPGESLDADLEKALRKLLDKDPAKRPQRGKDAAALFLWIEKKLFADAATTTEALRAAVGDPPSLEKSADQDATVRLMTQAQAVYTTGTNSSVTGEAARDDDGGEAETVPPLVDEGLEEPPFALARTPSPSERPRTPTGAIPAVSLPSLLAVPAGAGPKEALSSYAAQLRALEGQTPAQGVPEEPELAVVRGEPDPTSFTSTTTATPPPPTFTFSSTNDDAAPIAPVDPERRPLPLLVLGVGVGLFLGLVGLIVIGMRPGYVAEEHAQGRQEQEASALQKQDEAAATSAGPLRPVGEFAILDGRAGDRPKCFIEERTRAFSYKDKTGAFVVTKRMSEVPIDKREFVLCRE